MAAPPIDSDRRERGRRGDRRRRGRGDGRSAGAVRERSAPAAPDSASTQPSWTEAGIRILHEDADLLVIERGPSVSSSGLRRAIGQRSPREERSSRRGAWPVGTLEPGVTGLLLLARSPRARRALQREGAVRMDYVSAVEARGDEKSPNGRAGEPRVQAAEGIRRLLAFERRRPHRDLVEWLGRRGYRVLRDRSQGERLYLHGESLRFRHPDGERPLQFRSAPGRDLLQAGGGAASAERTGSDAGSPPVRPGAPPGATAVDGRPAPASRAARPGPHAHPQDTRPQDLRSQDLRSQDMQRDPTVGPQASAETRSRRPARSGRSPERAPASATTDWNEVADWFDALLEERSHDHYRELILPGTLRLLEAEHGMRLLDLASGQGVLCRALAREGVACVGVEASERLVAHARERSAGLDPQPVFHCGDVREPETLAGEPFDRASCVLALSNIDPIDPVLRACASRLRPGGHFVAVIPHPAFRVPRQSQWDWDRSETGAHRQRRSIAAYRSETKTAIVANPGAVARGEPAIETWTFHRPIEHYVNALAAAGLWVDRLEEWSSRRHSDSGPRAAEENRARREIPLFLALRARRV